MSVAVISNPSADVSVGGLWEVAVTVRDADGVLSSVVPDLVVTPPSGTPAAPVAMTQLAVGVYRTLVSIDAGGRWIGRVDGDTSGVADVTAWASSPVAGTGMPNLAAVLVYLRATSFSDDEVQDALDAEAQAQRDVCRIPANYPTSLRQALLRRVMRNLAMRTQPLAVMEGDAEGGDTVLPGRDPEVRRYEQPYRKLVMG